MHLKLMRVIELNVRTELRRLIQMREFGFIEIVKVGKFSFAYSFGRYGLV